jgi:hypothetical protein
MTVQLRTPEPAAELRRRREAYFETLHKNGLATYLDAGNVNT